MTMHSTVLRERGIILGWAFTSRASALAVALAVWTVAMIGAGMWIEGATRKQVMGDEDLA